MSNISLPSEVMQHIFAKIGPSRPREPPIGPHPPPAQSQVSPRKKRERSTTRIGARQKTRQRYGRRDATNIFGIFCVVAPWYFSARPEYHGHPYCPTLYRRTTWQTDASLSAPAVRGTCLFPTNTTFTAICVVGGPAPPRDTIDRMHSSCYKAFQRSIQKTLGLQPRMPQLIPNSVTFGISAMPNGKANVQPVAGQIGSNQVNTQGRGPQVPIYWQRKRCK